MRRVMQAMVRCGITHDDVFQVMSCEFGTIFERFMYCIDGEASQWHTHPKKSFMFPFFLYFNNKKK